jgi:D-3-phosphoglycerate dehydrogenase
MSAPIVTIVDPLTWTHGWSYDIERRILADAGVELQVPADEAERDRLLPIADVVVSSSLVSVDAALIETLDRCIGILCYSAGMDAVDVAAAKAKGITVANVTHNYPEVADHAVTLLLALLRKLPEMSSAAAQGQWDLRELPAVWDIPRLSEVVVGIIGAGRVGRAVGNRARAFGMTTIATYHTPPSTDEADLPHVALEDLAQRADAIVLCASLNADSHHIVDSSFLSSVKHGCVLVNVGRGGLIDEQALNDALDSGRIGAAALDVRDPEPPDDHDLLARRSNVLQTPHLAGASSGALRALHELAAEGIVRLLHDSGRINPQHDA